MATAPPPASFLLANEGLKKQIDMKEQNREKERDTDREERMKTEVGVDKVDAWVAGRVSIPAVSINW